MTLYLVKNQERIGPFSLEDVQRMRAAGQVRDTDLAWYQGLSSWIPLTQVPGIGEAITPLNAPLRAPSPPSPQASVAYAAPPLQPQPTSGNSPLLARILTAVVLSGIGFIFLWIAIFVIAVGVGGGIAGAHESVAQHAEGFAEGSQVGAEAGRKFGETYGPLIGGIAALLALVLAPLIACLMSFSNLFPWCRKN